VISPTSRAFGHRRHFWHDPPSPEPGDAQQILAGMVCEQGAECQRTRLEAARLLGLLPDSFDPLLSTLLAVLTLRSRGKQSGLWENCASGGWFRICWIGCHITKLGGEAAKALGEVGDTIVGACATISATPQ